MSLITKTPWTSQPQLSAATLAPGFNNALLEYVPAFMGRTYYRRGGDASGAGSLPTNWDDTFTPKGKAIVPNAARSVLKPLPQPTVPAEITLISIQTRRAASTAYTWHQMDGAGATNSHYTFSDNNFYIATFGTSRWINAVAIPSGVDLSVQHVCVITARTNNHRMWVQGRLIGSSGAAGTPTIATNFCIGRDDASNQFPGPITGVWVIPRFMEDSEAARISRSPEAAWSAIYAPQPRKLWIPEAAEPGGSVYNPYFYQHIAGIGV